MRKEALWALGLCGVSLVGLAVIPSRSGAG